MHAKEVWYRYYHFKKNQKRLIVLGVQVLFRFLLNKKVQCKMLQAIIFRRKIYLEVFFFLFNVLFGSEQNLSQFAVFK